MINGLIDRYEQAMQANSAQALTDLAGKYFVGSLGIELVDRADILREYSALFWVAEILDYRILERNIRLDKEAAVAELTAYVKDHSRFGGPEDVYQEYRTLEFRKTDGVWGVYKDVQTGIVD